MPEVASHVAHARRGTMPDSSRMRRSSFTASEFHTDWSSTRSYEITGDARLFGLGLRV